MNMHHVMSTEQEPENRVLGNFHGHRQKGEKRRVQLNDEVIEIPQFWNRQKIMLKSIYTLAYLWFSLTMTMTLIPFNCNNPETLRSMISVYYLCSTVVDLYWDLMIQWFWIIIFNSWPSNSCKISSLWWSLAGCGMYKLTKTRKSKFNSKFTVN